MIGSGPPLGQIGGTYRGSFRVKSPTGVLVNADSLPTGVLVVNGVDTGVTVTITNLATGRYAVSCSLAGRSLLDVCWVRINATAGGVADEDALPAFVVALDAAGLLKVDVEDFGGVGADPSQLWDVLQGNQTLDVNAAWIGGSAVAANAGTNLSTFFDVSPTLVNALGTSILFVDTATSSRASQSSVNTLQTAVNNLNNLSALANLYGPSQLEVPASGTIAYPFTLVVRDTEGHLANLSATPTVSAANAAGTDRSGKLSAVAHPSTGVYTFTYTVSAGDAQEGVSIEADGTAAGDSTARKAFASVAVVAVDTVAAIADIQTKTTAVYNKLPASTMAAASDVTAVLDAVGSPVQASDYAAPPTAQQNADAVAAAVLLDPTHKLATDASGYVTSTNGGGGGGNGTVNLFVTPAQANTSNPRYSTRDLPSIARGSAPQEAWAILDGAGNAVDLTGRKLRLVFSTRNADGTFTPKKKYETPDGVGGLSITGDAHNVVLVQHDPAFTATVGEYHYWLWDVTDPDAELVLMKGRACVEDASEDAP